MSRPVVASLLAALLSAHAAAAPEPQAQWGPIDVAHQRIEVGDKQKFRLIPQRSFEGSFLDMPIFAARGARPGPTLCVTAGIHGDELNSVEIARRAFAAVDPKRLNGTLIVFPAINAWGLRTSDRYLPDRRDLNRAFPGSPNGSVASIVADAVFGLLTKHCEKLIDLHTASDLRTNYPQIRADVSDPDTLALASRFGVGIVIDGAGPGGSLRREAQNAGIKSIIYEAGPPLIFREEEIARGTSGIMNVLEGLGMFASGAKSEKSQLLKRSFWVRVPRGQGGIFLPTVALGAAVKKGELLATVVDPLSDEVHEVRAEGDGTVVGMALPRVVLSGYGVFHIGVIESQ